ncbi:hypothetical protein Taro_034177 [Colocasia esculenta]|uniref:Uncharacterized protein n=1 Tax=Colocasia esculenta TaxID=4460 RepID=A0A843W010_COLES|nr:hypothetical protein [Colocasia esculenta]
MWRAFKLCPAVLSPLVSFELGWSSKRQTGGGRRTEKGTAEIREGSQISHISASCAQKQL